MNRNDNLYVKINYIREEIANEMIKRRSQPNINLNNPQFDTSNNGHMFGQENFSNKEEKKTENYSEIYLPKREENEKIVDEEEQLKSKFLYNKTFVNEDK